MTITNDALDSNLVHLRTSLHSPPPPPPPKMLTSGDWLRVVGNQVVCILLECFLVLKK